MDELDLALERHLAGKPPWTYFDRRVRGPEEARKSLPFAPAPASDAGKIFSSFLNNDNPASNRVVYVHIPFCEKICRFCGYNRIVASDKTLVEAYSAAVRRQAETIGKTAWAKAAAFDALYFGGGTPTAIPVSQLVRIVQTIKNEFQLSENCEITVESRIGDIGKDTLSKLLDAGVNRMSFGVQSFDTDVRRRAGRLEDRSKIVEKLESAKKWGLSNLCIDLIYNLEKQDVRSFEKDLETVGSLPVAGCDVYPLILFERSILKREIDEKTAEELPGLRTEYRFFESAEKFFENGWRRFSPVHFGKPGKERAVYVTARSRNSDMLALGAGGAGSIDNLFYLNPPGVADYIDAQDRKGEIPRVAAFTLPEIFLEHRKLFALSEGEGLPERLLQRFPDFHSITDKLAKADLVETKGDMLVLSKPGRFWAGNVSGVLGRHMAGMSPKTTAPQK